MDHFAHEGAKHPSFQRVDRGLEGNAEYDEEKVSHTQIEYEQVGGVVSELAASQQHSKHQAVANGSEKKDYGEYDGHNYAGGVQLVAFRNVGLSNCPAEIFKVRHFCKTEMREKKKRIHTPEAKSRKTHSIIFMAKANLRRQTNALIYSK